jgi:hypothetical protein
MTTHFCPYCKSYEDRATIVLHDVPETIRTALGEHKEQVEVDECLALEILVLWDKGIVTQGCCCGHGNLPWTPSILVAEESEQKMIDLGYKQYPHRSDMFLPMSMKKEDV